MQVNVTTMERKIGVPQKTKNTPSILSSNTFLSIYSNECKPEYNRAMCTPMFIGALFTKTKLWKHSMCPTTNKWIKKM
jgi:hypothetical protein